MKRLSIITLWLLTTLYSYSQINRTTPTIVVDVLAQLPRNDYNALIKSMELLLSTKEEGVIILASKLDSEAINENSDIEFLLNNLSQYALKDELKRNIVASGLETAISNTPSIIIKQFLLRQLEIVGTNRNLPFLKTLLERELYTLSKPISTILYFIGGNEAAKILEENLSMISSLELNQTNTPVAINLIQALGNIAIKESAALIEPFIKTDNTVLKQSVITALGNIANPSSQDILYKEALATKFSLFLPSNKSTAAYLKYLAETLKTDSKIGITLALQCYKQCFSKDNDQSYFTRLELLTLLSPFIQPKETNAMLLKEVIMVDSPKKLQGLSQVVTPFLKNNSSFVSSWVKLIKKSKDNAKSTVIAIIGDIQEIRYASLIAPYVKSKNIIIHNASLEALSKMGATEILLSFLETTNNASEIIKIQNAIIFSITYQQNYLEKRKEAILSSYNLTHNNNKVKFLQLFARIGGTKYFEIVNNALNSLNNIEKEEALKSLLVWNGKEAIPVLESLIADSTNPLYKSLQNEIVTAFVSNVENADVTPQTRYLLLRKAIEKPIPNHLKNIIIPGFFSADCEQTFAFLSSLLNNKELLQIPSVLNNMDYNGYAPLFNSIDLTGWKGLVENPIIRASLKDEDLAKKQIIADEIMRKGWSVKNGILEFNGKGDNLCTEEKYGNFEMTLDWLLIKGDGESDAGVYLRGTPQVQMWDTARRSVGAEVGSGGLYNNIINQSKPLKVADSPIGEWNTFNIKMIGDKVTVYLNGELVTDNVILENFWDRTIPIPSKEQIELQAHGTYVAYRNINIKKLPDNPVFVLPSQEKIEGYSLLFDGTNMHLWQGALESYLIEDGAMVVRPKSGSSGGNLYSKKEYKDFTLRFEFLLTQGANNGLGIRASLDDEDVAYQGVELQILDNRADVYKDLEAYQYHGSAYGLIPAKRGFQKPVGEWNYQEVTVKGNDIKIILNDEVILEGNLLDATKEGTLDNKEHSGLKRESGYIGFLGHGSIVKYKNIRIKEL